MTPDALLEKFETFADAPNAGEEMRKLILRTALRGRLVLQDCSEEPSAALVDRIREAKGGKALGATVNETTLHKIPESWTWVNAIFPVTQVSDRGKKIKTKEILDKGDFPVVDQGKVFVRGYCNDSDRVIKVTSPIVLFGDHTRQTKLLDFDFVVGADGVKLLKPIEVDPKAAQRNNLPNLIRNG